MALLNGCISIGRMLVLGPVPSEKDMELALQQDRFAPFQDGLEEERLGWCDWRNPLLEPDINWVSQEAAWVFALRVDTRKVDPATLKAHVDLRVQDYMKEKDLAFMGKEARLSIQDDVKVELLRKVQPRIKVVSIVWKWKSGEVFLDSTSTKVQGALVGLFMKSFGCELHPVGPLLMAGRVAPEISTEGLMSLDPLNLELEG